MSSLSTPPSPHYTSPPSHLHPPTPKHTHTHTTPLEAVYATYVRISLSSVHSQSHHRVPPLPLSHTCTPLLHLRQYLPVVLCLYLLPTLPQLQVVDDVESIVRMILAVDLLVLLLPHVVLEGLVVGKEPLTIQTLQTTNVPAMS